MRYLLELSFNGANYHGWQIQPNSVSIQETIERCLSTILNEKINMNFFKIINIIIVFIINCDLKLAVRTIGSQQSSHAYHTRHHYLCALSLPVIY